MVEVNVQAITISDEVAASTTFIATAARPTTTYTLANTSFASGGARNITVSTTGTSDNGKTVTIVGTDVLGSALTEIITSTGSVATVAGTKLFKTITSATVSAQYAANASVGSGSLCAQAIFAGPTRVKAFYIISGGTAGVIDLYNGTPESGTILFKARTIGTDNTWMNNTIIPNSGVLFASGAVVGYTVATIDMMTFFYA